MQTRTFRKRDLVHHQVSCLEAIRVLRGVSLQLVRRKKDKNRNVLGRLELGHVLA